MDISVNKIQFNLKTNLIGLEKFNKNDKESSDASEVNEIKPPTHKINKIEKENNNLFNLININDRKLFNQTIESNKSRHDLAHHKLAIMKSVFHEFVDPSLINKIKSEKQGVEWKYIQDNIISINELLVDNPQLKTTLLISQNNDPKKAMSSSEICDSIAEAIDSMEGEYLDVYQEAATQYAEFYSDFSDFMSKMNTYISAKDDKTVLNSQQFLADLKVLQDKYPVPGLNTTLYPVQNGELPIKGSTEAECNAWAKELGLDPEKCVSPLGDGTYIVHIDVEPLNKIESSIPPTSIPEMECNSAQWAAWQSGVDLQKESIQVSMQTITQKYANANSTFDNLVKILSSTISALLECDKSFFNI